VHGVAQRARFADVLAVGEFRALWLAYLLSVAGDQLALVALTVLVYDRTHSALLAAMTYAAGFLPWVLGGLALARLADRYPRREVMVTCDLVRVVLVAAMAWPGMPLWALIALLFAVTLLDSPFRSARSALLPDILDGERYVTGTAVMQITNRSGRMAGFAAGGTLVALTGTRPALFADAATFAMSALLVRVWVRRRTAAAPDSGGPAGPRRASALRLVFSDGRLRTLMLLGWLVPFYAVPEALAVPYAARLHGGAVAAGLVLASGPLGSIIGSAVFARFVEPHRRPGWMGPLAVCSCGLLGFCFLQPGLAASLVIFAVSTACSAYQLAANAAFVAAVPAAWRGRAFGVANGGIRVGQGAWFALAGAAAGVLAPASVVAASGVLGAVVAVTLAIAWRRLPAAVPAAPSAQH